MWRLRKGGGVALFFLVCGGVVFGYKGKEWNGNSLYVCFGSFLGLVGV